MIKIYTSKAKYISEKNNFLFKLIIFYNICIRTNIFLDIILKVLFIIITDLVWNYYYFIININIATICDQIYKSIQIYFDKTKYKKIVLFK